MALSIFPTAYLPPIAYMACLSAEDAVLIEQHETFPKQTYRNRTIIATANGLQTLSVPVVRVEGNHTRTSDMAISYVEPWNIKHWRAIETAYNAAPYFLYYRDGIEQILMRRYEKLIDLNGDLLQYLIKKLKLSCQTSLTTDYEPKQGQAEDFRDTFSCKKPFTRLQFAPYNQVFEERMPFQPNLSILDLLFNLGPDAKAYLQKTSVSQNN